MKNLIAELLFKLAQKEEESKELCADESPNDFGKNH
ncbi:protein iraP [Escherichia coli]|nr:protein iraP [Escherichia coli]